MNQNALDIAMPFTAGEESFSPAAYYDANGYAIGYGNHYYGDGSRVQSGDRISKTEADQLLIDTLADNISAIESQLMRTIPDGLLAALADLRYNCGTITITLLNLINSGAGLDAIRDQYLQTCLTSNGQYLQVLADRRARAWSLVSGSAISPIILMGAAALIIGILILKHD